MKRFLWFTLLTATLGLFASGGLAQLAPNSVNLVTTFAYRGNVDETAPHGINDRGEIVGSIRNGGVTQGFIRYADGRFGPLLVEPNDTSQQTIATAINNSRTIAGSYVDSSGYHGFFYNQGGFSEFTLAGGQSTTLNGLNGAGDFVGGYFPADSSPTQGYASIGGSVVFFQVPGNTYTEAYGINRSGAIAGSYYDQGGSTPHGFYRDPAGNFIYPLDYPGSTYTFILGINDRGWMVGNYANASGLHGFVAKLPNTFISFDGPGTSTFLTGINNQGLICGFYNEGSIRRGLTAQLERN